MGMVYDWEIVFGIFLPVCLFPVEPAGLFLIKNIKGFVAKLSEFCPPPCPSFDRSVLEDFTDDVDLLTAVDLIPNALEQFSQRWSFGISPVHQTRHIFQADIS